MSFPVACTTADTSKKSLENDMNEVDWDVAERPQEMNSYHSHHRPIWWVPIGTTTTPADCSSSTVPSSTVPSSTVPSSTVPSSTVPSSTVPSPIVPDAIIFLYLSDKSLEEFCTCRNKESTTPTTQPGLMKESTCSTTRSGKPNKGLIHLIEATRPPQKLFPRVNVSTTQGPACPHSPHPSQPPIQQHQVPTPTQSAHPTTATLHPMMIVEHRQLVPCPYCGNDISMVFVPLSDNGPTTEHVYQSAPMVNQVI
ncbi:hypothetical protein AAG570_005179 [Ranatra chinensis]|uniref:LITAF domain-containing protein n=1 Tax=Ranatra chinensis TaxID=642074 RepID=A0ABD0XZP2_9HEMI